MSKIIICVTQLDAISLLTLNKLVSKVRGSIPTRRGGKLKYTMDQMGLNNNTDNSDNKKNILQV